MLTFNSKRIKWLNVGIKTFLKLKDYWFLDDNAFVLELVHFFLLRLFKLFKFLWFILIMIIKNHFEIVNFHTILFIFRFLIINIFLVNQCLIDLSIISEHHAFIGYSKLIIKENNSIRIILEQAINYRIFKRLEPFEMKCLKCRGSFNRINLK